MATEISNWIDMSKAQKEAFVRIAPPEGDMPPIVLGAIDDVWKVCVIAPNVDKHEGLQAAHILRKGLGVDSILLITDCYMQKCENEEDVKQYKEGLSLQERYVQGDKSVLQIISCFLYRSDGSFYMESIPYTIENGIVKWEKSFSYDEGTSKGFIVESLQQIMEQPIAFQDNDLQKAALKCHVDEDEAKKVIKKISLEFLEKSNFIVVDFDKPPTRDSLYTQMNREIRDKWRK